MSLRNAGITVLMVAGVLFSSFRVQAASISITQNGVGNENSVTMPVREIQPAVQPGSSVSITNVITPNGSIPERIIKIEPTGYELGPTVRIENQIQPTGKPQPGTCQVGGCSGQLCYDPAVDPGMSTCEWRDEYACYRYARCERQSDGRCGWTETDQYRQCRQGPPTHALPTPIVNGPMPTPCANCITVPPPIGRCDLSCPVGSTVDEARCICGVPMPTIHVTPVMTPIVQPTPIIEPGRPTPPNKPAKPWLCRHECPDGTFRMFGTCSCRRIPQFILKWLPVLSNTFGLN